MVDPNFRKKPVSPNVLQIDSSMFQSSAASFVIRLAYRVQGQQKPARAAVLTIICSSTRPSAWRSAQMAPLKIQVRTTASRVRASAWLVRVSPPHVHLAKQASFSTMKVVSMSAFRSRVSRLVINALSATLLVKNVRELLRHALNVRLTWSWIHSNKLAWICASVKSKFGTMSQKSVRPVPALVRSALVTVPHVRSARLAMCLTSIKHAKRLVVRRTRLQSMVFARFVRSLAISVLDQSVHVRHASLSTHSTSELSASSTVLRSMQITTTTFASMKV